MYRYLILCFVFIAVKLSGQPNFSRLSECFKNNREQQYMDLTFWNYENQSKIIHSIDSALFFINQEFLIEIDSLLHFKSNYKEKKYNDVANGESRLIGLSGMCELYIESLQYSGIEDPVQKFKKAISNGHRYLITKKIESLSVNNICDIINSAQSEAEIEFLYTDLIRGSSNEQLINYYNCWEGKVNPSHPSFGKCLNFFKFRLIKNEQIESLYKIQVAKFLAIIDTTNIDHLSIKDYIIDGKLTPFQLRMKAEKEQQENVQDSIVQAIQIMREQRIANIDKNEYTEQERKNLEDFIRSWTPSGTTPTNKRLYVLDEDEIHDSIARADTTLFEIKNKFQYVKAGDDGRRFDTLDNVQLFTELLKINLDELKREYNTVSIINTQPRLIHLQKIVQLIGDRYISKQLIPNASQQSQIDSLLNFIEYNMMIDSNDLWESISIDLMYRLWFLGVPKIKSWIKTDNYALNRFLGQNLHYFADEAMVKELVQKFEDEYATGNKYEATSYLGPLQYIDFLKKVDKYELHLPPRRVPQRTFDQSQEWCEKYIYPAFVKAGWLVEVK